MKKDLSVMIKPASSICNMRCKYCFYHSLADSREVFSYGLMNENTAKNVIEKAIDFCDGGSVCFAFQGGEPLFAGKEYFEFFVKHAGGYSQGKCKLYYTLQTNGTLIDDEWAGFFARNNFLLGVSLDGNTDANRFRKDAEGNYTFPKVRAALDILKRYNVQFNILTVATGYTAEHIEKIYSYLTSEGFRHLQFIPCLRPFEDKSESQLYMTTEQYGAFMIRLFNLYVKDYVKGNYVSVRQLDNYVRLFLGQKTEQCGVEGHCCHQFVIESNGNVYPCDFYCVDEWLLGNINDANLDELAQCERAKEFIKESLVIPDKCKKCAYFRVCRAGGCKRMRADRDYCEAYRRFFGACLPLFRVFLSGEKSADRSNR